MESYNLPLSESVPGYTFNYSDHEAVVAKLVVEDSNGGCELLILKLWLCRVRNYY